MARAAIAAALLLAGRPAGGQDVPAAEAGSAAGADTVAVSAGGGPPVLDFERFPDGSPACDRCPVGGEFATFGVRFAFDSPYTGTDEATLFASGAYDPTGEEENHSVSAAWTEEGFVPGILLLAFPGGPAAVSFRLRGSEVVRRFSVEARDAEGAPLPPSAVDREQAGTYRAVRGGLFREVRITVRHPGGVSAVALDGRGPPGHILLVDDLRIAASAEPPGRGDGARARGEAGSLVRGAGLP